MWQLLIIFYFIFGTASYLLRRVLAQRIGEHNRLINAIFFLFFLLPAALILSQFFPHNLRVGALNVILLLVGSLIFPISYVVSFHANRKVDVGIFTIINNLTPLATLLVAMPFLNERLRIAQFFGVGLLILSGVLASWSQVSQHRRSNLNGILVCIASAAILGVAIAYERFMLNRVDFGAYLIYGWGAQIAWGLILAGRELKQLPVLLGKNLGARSMILTWGAVSVLRSVTFISSLKLSTASVISSASNFLSVAVVIVAYFFLKEREHIVSKIIAVVIGVAGLLLIAT